MRITPQQLQIQLKDIKPQGKAPKLDAGTVVRGKILSVQADAIMIQLQDGATLRAAVEETGRFVEGDRLSFKVLESDTQELPKLEILEKSGVEVKELLNKVDIKPTPENVKAFDVLKSLGLNVSKEAIETLTKNFQFVSKLNDSLDQMIPKDLTGKFPEGIKMSDVMVKDLAPEFLEKFSESLKFPDVESFKNADFKTVVLKVLDRSVPQETADVDSAKVHDKTPKEIVKEVFGLIRDAGDKVELADTMEKMGQLLKLKKPLNFKNMSVLDKLSFDEGKISEQVKSLINELKPDQKELLALLKGFEPSKMTSEKAVSEYFNDLLSSLSEASDDAISTRVKSQITQLSESIQFLENTQEDVTWLQIPMQINEQTQNVDIYFKNDKKEGRQLTKDNAKILVALNTEYLDIVQAFIQVKGQRLDINFRVQHDSVVQLIEKHSDVLKDYFDMYDTHIFVENRSRMSFVEFVEEDSKHHFDVKV